MRLDEHVFSNHALEEMERRDISISCAINVIANYDTKIGSGAGREIFQKSLFVEDLGKNMLYRVVVDSDRKPPVVVTAYRTSKIYKYVV